MLNLLLSQRFSVNPSPSQKFGSCLLLTGLLLAGCGAPQANSGTANPPAGGVPGPGASQPVSCTPPEPLPTINAPTGTADFDVLVFVKNSGCRLDAVKSGVAAIQKLGTDNRFTVNATDDAGVFTEQGLAAYEAVVFLNTSGDVLNEEQQAVFQKFIRSGKGFVGVHAAAETELNWHWYGALVGAYLNGKPRAQQASVQVVNKSHASTQGLPDSLSLNDEWYSFREVQGNIVPLLNLDENSVAEIPRMGSYHPVSWYQFYDGGRSWYTGLGGQKEMYADENFRKHLLGGIRWAANTSLKRPATSWNLAAPAPRQPGARNDGQWESQGLGAEGKLFVFGGDVNGDVPVQAIGTSMAYSLATNSWTAPGVMPDMPVKLTHGGQALDGRTIWIAGGFIGNSDSIQTSRALYKYDLASNTWSRGRDLPEPRGGGALVRLERTLHFFGGTVRTGKEYAADSGKHWTLNLDDPNANWVPKKDYPSPANHMAGVALNGKVYGLGGQLSGNENNGNVDKVYAYDPATDQWEERAPMKRKLAHIAASTFVRGGRIVVVGGVTNIPPGYTKPGGLDVAFVSEYIPYGGDGNKGQWEDLTPIPAPRQSPVAGIVNGRIVVSTGENFYPQAETWVSE